MYDDLFEVIELNLSYVSLQSFDTVGSQNEPEPQRSKAASERYLPVLFLCLSKVKAFLLSRLIKSIWKRAYSKLRRVVFGFLLISMKVDRVDIERVDQDRAISYPLRVKSQRDTKLWRGMAFVGA